MIMLHIHRKKLQRKQVTLLYYDRRNAMGTEKSMLFLERMIILEFFINRYIL